MVYNRRKVSLYHVSIIFVQRIVWLSLAIQWIGSHLRCILSLKLHLPSFLYIHQKNQEGLVNFVIIIYLPSSLPHTYLPDNHQYKLWYELPGWVSECMVMVAVDCVVWIARPFRLCYKCRQVSLHHTSTCTSLFCVHWKHCKAWLWD